MQAGKGEHRAKLPSPDLPVYSRLENCALNGLRTRSTMQEMELCKGALS